MTTPAEPLSVPQCTVCGTEVALDTAKCPSCGLARPAAKGSQVLGRSGFWLLGVVLLALYAVVLVIVAAALTPRFVLGRCAPGGLHPAP